jgi:tetratricopeptide (TPR) repeat protein
VRTLLASVYQEYSKSLIEKGDLVAAQTILEASVSALPENDQLVTRLLIVKKDREAERLYHLGLDEIKLGKQELALTTLSKALTLNPSLKQAKKQITDLKLSVIESYHKKAMVLYRKQELGQAIQVWDKILQLDPNYELAKQYKAKALELQRKIEQL